MKKILLSGIVLLVLSAFYASAATINVASCSYADVLSAITSAASGDTVSVPAGKCTWSSQLVITKGIILKGAGIDKTAITSNYFASSSSVLATNNYLIVFQSLTPAKDDAFRISGFTINLAGKCKGVMVKNRDYYAYPLTQIRIDHNRITSDSYNGTSGTNLAAMFYGFIYGVVDSNQVDKCTFRHAAGNDIWTYSPFNFGTSENIFYEDNNFTNQGPLQFYAEMGARYCVRHNTFKSLATDNGMYPFADMHGNQASSYTGTIGAEVYENTITCNLGITLVDQRGGKALVYNNVINAPSVGTKLREEQLDSNNPPASHVISGQPQHVSQSYYWGNRKNGAALIDLSIDPSITQTLDYGESVGLVPRWDVDGWKETKLFTGVSGMGVGLLSARPPACVVGVAYWATDTKILYRCNATNGWVKYYTPFTYPHPLRTDCVKYPSLCDSGSSPPPPPAAIPGDLNGDRKVDISDLVIVATNFGRTSGFDVRANVVSSSPEVIDISDLSFVAFRFTG